MSLSSAQSSNAIISAVADIMLIVSVIVTEAVRYHLTVLLAVHRLEFRHRRNHIRHNVQHLVLQLLRRTGKTRIDTDSVKAPEQRQLTKRDERIARLPLGWIPALQPHIHDLSTWTVSATCIVLCPARLY